MKVDAENPDAGAIREAAAVIRGGGLVVFPTETVYGLAANAFDVKAVRKVFEAKSRSFSSPLPVQVGDRASIEEVAVDPSDDATRLADRFMPGPITLILRRNPAISDIVTAGGETIAVRIPDNVVAIALLREFGGPIVATSANVSGQQEPRDAAEAIKQIGASVDVVLDAGPTRYGEPSTVVDTTVTPPRVVRQGALSADEIRKVIGGLVA